MKSIILVGEAGCGKTAALAQLTPLLRERNPHLAIQPLNDRFLFEEEVQKETAHLVGDRRAGEHSVGYYDQDGKLTGFFVVDNEINQQVMARLMEILAQMKEDKNRLAVVELGIGVNRLAGQGQNPFRWGLLDRLEDARLSGIPLGEVGDVIVIGAPYELRWRRQQGRSDKTPEEAFANYSGEGGLPINFRDIFHAQNCHFEFINNNHGDKELFQQQLLEAVARLRPELVEGKFQHPEGQFSRRGKEF